MPSRAWPPNLLRPLLMAPAPDSPTLHRLHEIERAEEAQALLRHQLAQQPQPQQRLAVEDVIENAPLPSGPSDGCEIIPSTSLMLR